MRRRIMTGVFNLNVTHWPIEHTTIQQGVQEVHGTLDHWF